MNTDGDNGPVRSAEAELRRKLALRDALRPAAQRHNVSASAIALA